MRNEGEGEMLGGWKGRSQELGGNERAKVDSEMCVESVRKERWEGGCLDRGPSGPRVELRGRELGRHDVLAIFFFQCDAPYGRISSLRGQGPCQVLNAAPAPSQLVLAEPGRGKLDCIGHDEVRALDGRFSRKRHACLPRFTRRYLVVCTDCSTCSSHAR